MRVCSQQQENLVPQRLETNAQLPDSLWKHLDHQSKKSPDCIGRRHLHVRLKTDTTSELYQYFSGRPGRGGKESRDYLLRWCALDRLRHGSIQELGCSLGALLCLARREIPS